MRLLNVQTLEFRDFHGDRIPPYAVTSHRWSENEATYKDFLKRRNTESIGYQKILNFCTFVHRVCREPKNPQKPIDWAWVDTCCINQDSSAEVSESINSMWRWYSNATHCIAHLKDVRSFTAGGGQEGVLFDFRNSEWFERGWTLQELLAPACVVFVTHNWEIIGRKSAENHSCTATPNIMNSVIAEITGIPQDVLSGFESRRRLISRDTKMAWAANRRTTKEEDVAYCLLGIFDVHMIMIYGEGERNARKRLEREIQNKEREDDLDFGVSIYQQSTPRLGVPDNDQVGNDWDMVMSDEQTKIDAANHKLSEMGKCNVCLKLMVDPLRTSCNHRLCESCNPYRKEDKLIVLFEPGESVGKAEGDAATRNFSHLHPCPVCGAQAYLQHNSALAQQLQVEFPTTYTARTAEINRTLGDCEILTISIGNWHELVGPNAHRWTFFVKPSRTDIIEMVYIRLHESFQKDTDNLLRKPPYTIHGQGWGYFAIFVRIVLRSGYQWVCEHAEEGPYGAPNACLKLGWMLDFESHRGRGSKGRCTVKFKRERPR